MIGNPIEEASRFNQWRVDELIYLDISQTGVYDLRRDDQKISGLNSPLDILEEVSRRCFMPLTWGGRVSSVTDIRDRLARGADKVAINSAAFRTPSLITEGARACGSQAIVVSIDARRHPDGRTEVFIDGGRTPTGRTPDAWAREAAEHGAGEILLQSIDRDGTARGYDEDLIRTVAAAASVPVVACGGVGHYNHFSAGIAAGASAVAAANLWHFRELADRDGKRAMKRAGIDVRM